MNHALTPPGSEGYVDPMETYEPEGEVWTIFGFQQKNPVSDSKLCSRGRGGGMY